MPIRALSLAVALTVGSLALMAQTLPATINYQGRLTDNSPSQVSFSGIVPMQFEIWGVASGGTASPDRLWREPNADNAGTPVSVTGGVFSIALGATNPIPPSLFAGANSTRYLQIILNPGASQEVLAPRQQIASSGYAALAQNANSALAAASATDANQLGGVAAWQYALKTDTAPDSAKLGGSPASAWQKALVSPSCADGEFLVALNADGTKTCGVDTGSLASLAVLTTAAGTYTPTAGTKSLIVECVGGGGGGGGVTGASASTSVGGGGGSGSYGRVVVAAPAASYSYTIGPGGTAGPVGGAGGAGGMVAFGGLLSCNGGAGGAGSAAGTTLAITAGGDGGAAGLGSIATPGESGGDGLRMSGTVAKSGRGGKSYFAAGAPGVLSSAGGTAVGWGAGGSGAATTTATNRFGGAGAPGVIVITAFR